MNKVKPLALTIKPRVRLIIIKDHKILLTHTSLEDFYFYIGGKIEFGETIEQACKREVVEECGEGAVFNFNKILYIRDFIKNNEHSIEFFVLGGINKFSEIEGKIDPEFPDSHTQRWLNLDNLPANLYPQSLTKVLLEDYKNGFPNQGLYLGGVE